MSANVDREHVSSCHGSSEHSRLGIHASAKISLGPIESQIFFTSNIKVLDRGWATFTYIAVIGQYCVINCTFIKVRIPVCLPGSRLLAGLFYLWNVDFHDNTSILILILDPKLSSFILILGWFWLSAQPYLSSESIKVNWQRLWHQVS